MQMGVSARASYAGAARVAVIDDDPEFQHILSQLIARAGHAPVELPPSRDIAASIAGVGPALVVLDLNLGMDDAVRVLGEISAFGLDMPVALVSGLGPETLDEVRSVGLCHGLRMLSSMPKPIRRGALEQVLAEARLGTDGSAEPVEVDIEEAIANRQLRVWYQPQVELDGGRISGLEALVRLDHPTHGLLQPDRFLPRLRAKDHLLLTGYVLARVLKDHAGLAELGSGLGVSVNASMAMLGEADLMDALQSIWIGVPDRPRLTIEITEDRHSSDLAGINSLALRLKLHGIALSLDDFGAEYSSFHRLQSIGFSEMKLDKRYVTGCGQSDSLRAICQSTIGIARHLGLRSVAEGVESASDLATIREAGFDVAQGYYFCHPAPIEQLRSMLADGWAGAAAH